MTLKEMNTKSASIAQQCFDSCCCHVSKCLPLTKVVAYIPECLHRNYLLSKVLPHLEYEDSDILTHGHRVLGLAEKHGFWRCGLCSCFHRMSVTVTPKRQESPQSFTVTLHMTLNDSFRATMSLEWVLYQMQNQHTQYDLDERAKDVNDHVYISSCLDIL